MENNENQKDHPFDKNKSAQNDTFESNSTTGSGLSQAERNVQDGTNSDVNNGSEELVEKYNINDKAYSDSSKKDFVETTSNFHHADETDEESEEE